MVSASWRKRLAIVRSRVYLYPEPEPLPHGRLFWVASGLVALAVLIYSIYFITLLLTRHAAFLTNGEDLGIMDQALWNTVHGRPLHETICNIVSDKNCGGTTAGVMRFAIHVEPILFPISLLYLFWPAPETLLVLQTVVVALGAFPAFWLARLRLRNELVAVAIAVLYLLYPTLQQAITFDFHAVVLTASLLLFTLYFMYTRRTVALFICAFLALMCKEEIALVLVMFGLWSMVFQARWRVGLGLIGMALVWLAIAYFILMPHASPTGKPLLGSLYAYLGSPKHFIITTLLHPKGFIQNYILEKNHAQYLYLLLSPVLFLPVLAPWILILALPSLLLNLLSSSPTMYSGSFHYSAEIVPALIFATIEALVLIVWLGRILLVRLYPLYKRLATNRLASLSRYSGVMGRVASTSALVVLLVPISYSMFYNDYMYSGQMPFTQGFQWPQVTSHMALGEHLISLIPPDASVSAQTRLVPHISHREHIYLFPYVDDDADYDFLDVTVDTYPFGPGQYMSEVKRVLLSGRYGIVAAQDGYLLLKRGLPAPGVSPLSVVKPGEGVDPGLVLPALPASFCSNIVAEPQEITHPLQVDFTTADNGSMSLVGYDATVDSPFSRSSSTMNFTTYWRVSTPSAIPLKLEVQVQGSDGKVYGLDPGMSQFSWCQSNEWKPGTIIRIASGTLGLSGLPMPNGLAHMSIALLPLVPSSSTIVDVQARLPLHIVHAPGSVVADQDNHTLQLLSLSLVD